VDIVQLPEVGARGNVERAALRRGLATAAPVRLVQVLPRDLWSTRAYCAGCRGPVAFGSVTRSGRAYCSIECSLGVDHTA
jgi:hypothetical protein